ncbi:MAG: hypothetical protein PSX81_04405 [bacterium]|nr:hypothetical protein [bacterium]
MGKVTYFPQNQNCFNLTCNRDVDLLKEVAVPINKYKINGVSVYCPKDPKGGGSWIAAGSNGFNLCLLNGAFDKTKTKLIERRSRGLALLDFFNYKDHNDFMKQYDFNTVESFSLIIVHQQNKKLCLLEIIWDGKNIKLLNHDPALPHIWSSNAIYSEDVIKQRERGFINWVKKNEIFSRDSILMFHHFGSSGDVENDMVMNRSGIKTVSICSINKKTEIETEMIYEDLLNIKFYSNRIIGN